ncbi:MAG: hypothetical protein LBK12_06750 [Odoribacteraceae bacterium]|nr:hypothetical protein [Odoribacteraceae bacterium]
MKKTVLLIILLLAAYWIQAQIAVTFNGLRNANDITSSEIIIKCPGITKEKLLDAYKESAKAYAERSRNMSFLDGENGIVIRFSGVGRFGTGMVKTGNATFSLLFTFEDEVVVVEGRDLKLRRIGLVKGEGSRQYIYTRKGRLGSKTLKRMVEREVNTHLNQITETANLLIAVQKGR